MAATINDGLLVRYWPYRGVVLQCLNYCASFLFWFCWQRFVIIRFCKGGSRNYVTLLAIF